MNALSQLRLIGLLEGCSYLVLLFVAMPLKYFAGIPTAVRVTGSLHGLLFVLFILALVRAAFARRWPISRSMLAFAASLVPFGNFALDRSLKREMDEVSSAGVSSP